MLAFDTVGHGEGPFVVLLHGWPLDRSIWREVAPRIADAGFRVLAPDLPGFGDSPPVGPPGITVESYADDVARFLAAFGPRRLAVAGHSFGGYVALALAERHPDVASGLGLVASRTTADSEVARQGRLDTIEKVRAGGSNALLPGLAEKLVGPAADPKWRREAARLIELARPEGVIAGLGAMARRPDRSAVLATFPGPVLVVHGMEDALIPVTEAASPSRGDATVRVLPGVGHMPMWESPGPTADAIARWASRSAAPGSPHQARAGESARNI
jgi:pimeloyl-ACP methyl ester carboxylesterase